MMNRAVTEPILQMEGNSFPGRPFHFFALSFLLFILLLSLPEALLAPLNNATALLSALYLKFFGFQATVSGEILSLGSFKVRIITECTPLYSMLLFGSFILTAPAGAKARLTGLLFGSAFLGTADILRIAMVTLVGAYYPGYFEAVHVYLAQIVMLILVIAVSIFWLRSASQSERGEGPFFLRTLLVASLLFPVWLLLNDAYVRCTDILVTAIFRKAGYTLLFTYDHSAYFQTFNTVLFVALIAADRRLTLRRRMAWMAAGSIVLAFGHILFRIGNVFLTAFAWRPALPLTISINLFGEYLLPLMLWVSAVKTSMREKASAP